MWVGTAREVEPACSRRYDRDVVAGGDDGSRLLDRPDDIVAAIEECGLGGIVRQRRVVRVDER